MRKKKIQTGYCYDAAERSSEARCKFHWKHWRGEKPNSRCKSAPERRRAAGACERSQEHCRLTRELLVMPQQAPIKSFPDAGTASFEAVGFTMSPLHSYTSAMRYCSCFFPPQDCLLLRRSSVKNLAWIMKFILVKAQFTGHKYMNNSVYL